MIQRLLFFVAGVDRKTMLECPATDRMWAAHIGLSLCLSFTVVLGIAFVATGYMIDQLSARIAISIVIAATVFMFDRALFQSDWFVQGAFHPDDGIPHAGGWRHIVGRFVRISARLTISFGLAWVIALFLELAIFSDTINARIERDRIAANRPAFDELASFSADLDRQIAERAAKVATLEQTLLTALADKAVPDGATSTPDVEWDRRVKALADTEAALRAEVRQIEATIQKHMTDMNAEELGQKLSAANSGRTGQGPRYEFAKRQKDVLEAMLQSRQAELLHIAAREEEIRKAETDRAAAAAQRVAETQAALTTRRDALRAQVDAARTELRQAEADKIARVAEFRRDVMERSYVQARKDRADPLTRIAAYQELKSDPKDGRIITLFSWMTRFLVIFLEIVPVIAKIFFSPPSVYATRVRDDVRRARQQIRDRVDAIAPPPPQSAAPTAVSGHIKGRWQPSIRARVPDNRLTASTPPKPSADAARPGPGRGDWWNRRSGARTGDVVKQPSAAVQSAKPQAAKSGQAPSDTEPAARAIIKQTLPTVTPSSSISKPELRSLGRNELHLSTATAPAPPPVPRGVPSAPANAAKREPLQADSSSTRSPDSSQKMTSASLPRTESSSEAVTKLIDMMSDELSQAVVKR